MATSIQLSSRGERFGPAVVARLSPIVLAVALAVSIGWLVVGRAGLVIATLGMGVVAVWVVTRGVYRAVFVGDVIWPHAALIPWFFMWGCVNLLALPQSDSRAYYLTALASTDNAGGQAVYASTGTGKEGYVFILSQLFRLGEPSMVAPIALNAGLLALTSVVTARTTYVAFGRPAARTMPFLVALSPPLVIWGAPGLREAAVYLGLAVMLSLTVTIARGRLSLTTVPCLVAATSSLLFFRATIVPVTLVGLLLALALSMRGAKRMALLVSIPPMGYAMYRLVFALGGSIIESSYDMQRIGSVRSSLGTSDSGFGDYALSPVSFVIGLLRVFVGPFPWEWTQFPLAIMDSIYWMAMSILLFRARVAVGRAALVLFGGPAFAVAVSVVVSITNYGALLRFRGMVLIMLAPLVAASFAHVRAARDRKSAAARTIT